MDTIQTYPNLVEAQVAKGLLGSEGIDAFILEEDDNTSGLASAYGSIHLRVRKSDFEAAKRILAERGPFSEDVPTTITEP